MDQFYFEEGYLEASYFTVVREAVAAFTVTVSQTAAVDIADATGYYIPDYIATDYFEAGGQVREADAVFTVTATQATVIGVLQSAESTQIITVTMTPQAVKIVDAACDFGVLFASSMTAEGFKNHTADMQTQSQFTVDAVANRSANVLLDYIADLNAMAAKTVDVNSNLSHTATQSTTASITASTTANLATSAQIVCILGEVHSAQSQLTANCSLTTSRYFGKNRPRNIVETSDNNYVNYFNTAYNLVSGGTHGIYSGADSPVIFGGPLSDIVPTANESWVLSFSYLCDGTTTARSFFYSFTDSTGSERFLRLATTNTTGSQFQLNLFKTGQSTVTETFTVTQFTTTRIAISYHNGYVAVFKDGVRTALIDLTAQTSTTWTGHNQLTKTRWSIGARTAIDEFHYSRGTFLEYNPQSTSVTATGRQTNAAATTEVLWHLDNNGLDDISVTESAASALTSAFTQQTVNTGTFVARSAQAAMPSTASVSALGGKLQSATVNFSSAFSQSTSADRFARFESALNVTVTVTTVIGSIKSAESINLVAFDTAFSATAQLAGVALLETESAVTALAVKTTDVVSQQSSTVSITATLTGEIRATADLAVTVTQSTDSERTRSTAAALASAFDHTVLDTLFKGHSADLAVTATVAVDATKLKIAEATVNVTVTTAISAQKTTDVISTQSLSTAISTDNLRVRFADSTQSTQVTVTADAVLTSDPVMAFSVQTLQITNAVKTADSDIIAVSLFTPSFDVDFITRPQVFFETQSTLSVLTGVIKQGRNFGTNTGLQIQQNPMAAQLLVQPFFGFKVRTVGFTASQWIKREANLGQTLEQIWGQAIGANENRGSFCFRDDDLLLRFNYDPDEPNPTWSGVAPSDGEWHHYVIRAVNGEGSGSSGSGSTSHWRLWIDGVDQGLSSGYFAAGQITFFKAGTFNNEPYGEIAIGRGAAFGIPEPGGTSSGLTGAMAQLWMGYTFNLDITAFYDGFRDFGDDGTRGGRLPTPNVYNRLTRPWTGVVETISGGPQPIQNGLASSQPLDFPTTIAVSTLTAQPAVALVFTADLVSTVTQQTAITYASAQATVNVTAQAQQITAATQFIGIVADLANTTTLAASISKTTGFDAALTAQAEIVVLAGFFETAEAALSVAAEFICDFDNIPPTRGEADLASAFTLTADANSFTDSTTLTVSAFTVACDATLIPPIRVEADLTVTATMSVTIGSIEQFAVLVVSAGTMTISAVKNTGIVQSMVSSFNLAANANKFHGIILTLSAFNSQLTVGDVINLDPALTLRVRPESRTIKITQETRVRRILPETRVNIIED